jgi:hypothetical protein
LLFDKAMEAGELLAILSSQAQGGAVAHHAAMCAPTLRAPLASST